jgi:TPP-dependent pyruvate/acetoin dehydrogenase alpha subunit
MVLIRFFEERTLELFTQGKLFGTTHCCIGQEATAVAIINHLRDEDVVVSNHRCHGHYLVRTGDVQGLMAELMGKSGGVCGGRGGSQHLCKDNFYTNGVQGSIVPIAAGMALAEKIKGTGAITVLFIGDGTLGQGTVYETFNMISLWQVPILVVIENNFYAQTTPTSLNLAGSFTGRPKAFGISTSESEAENIVELYEKSAQIIESVRSQTSPFVQIIHTYRFCPHSKGDDYRPKQEIESWQRKDPLKRLEKQIPVKYKSRLEEQARQRIEQAVVQAGNMPFPSLDKKD